MSKELVSVIIANLEERFLQQTIDSVMTTADEVVEVIVENDDESKGMRHCLNKAANRAKGDFLFKIDGHCIMSPHWDTILKTVCEDQKDLAVSRIREINWTKWELTNRGYDFVQLNPDLSVGGCGKFTPDDPDVSETVAFTGCGFMMHHSRFDELEQNWEALGRYGNLGAEWALKIWLSGGRLLLSRHVTCGHVFRKQGVLGCLINDQIKAREVLFERFANNNGPLQTKCLRWLPLHFMPITEESNVINQS